MSDRKPGSDGERRLQQLFGTGGRAGAFYKKQMLAHLSPAMREYIARQDLMFIATADAKGECDCSLRAGDPGFVRVLDEKTLAYPELRGNGVLSSLGNLVENPHIALAFFDFCVSTVGLHVNGHARIVDALPDQELSVFEKRTERWVVVDVVEAYIHCSKHIPLMKKLDKRLAPGADERAKGAGDYFNARREPRPWVLSRSPFDPPAEPAPVPPTAEHATALEQEHAASPPVEDEALDQQEEGESGEGESGAGGARAVPLESDFIELLRGLRLRKRGGDGEG